MSIESPLPASGALSDLTSAPQEDTSYSQSSAGMRASKSDTSLTDSFVVIPPVSSASQIDESNSKRKINTVQNHLKEGIQIYSSISKIYNSIIINTQLLFILMKA